MSRAKAWRGTASRRPRACSRQRAPAPALITDYWEGIEQFFEPGSEILVARNGDEVLEVMDSLNDRRAAVIGRAAYRGLVGTYVRASRRTGRSRAAGQREEGRVLMARSLDIVILGLSVTSSWGNGHATTYRSLIRGWQARDTAFSFWSAMPWYRDNRDQP